MRTFYEILELIVENHLYRILRSLCFVSSCNDNFFVHITPQQVG